MSTLNNTQEKRDWELEFIRTGQIECVPEEDRERVLKELQELSELARLLVEKGSKA